MKPMKREGVPAKRDVFADFFDSFFNPDLLPSTDILSPAVDIEEDKEKYVVKADIPGMKQDQIKIEVDDGILKISGERKSEKTEEDKEKKYHYYERSFGSFERRFVLPPNVDEDKIDAKYENGVLEIKIPKTESKKSKEIKIK